jgi:small subunit ribosomal protein S12e
LRSTRPSLTSTTPSRLSSRRPSSSTVSAVVFMSECHCCSYSPSFQAVNCFCFVFFLRCAKALDRGAASLCVLSNDCDNAEYKKLIQALCAESSVPLIMADAGTQIGEWVGLAKLNADGTVRKAVRCSVAVVTDFGEETPALNVVLNYVKSQNA